MPNFQSIVLICTNILGNFQICISATLIYLIKMYKSRHNWNFNELYEGATLSSLAKSSWLEQVVRRSSS